MGKLKGRWLRAADAELLGKLSLFPLTQTRRSAGWLSVKMMQDGHQVAMLTAELSTVQRTDVIQRFRDGQEKVLITTNVCARGQSQKHTLKGENLLASPVKIPLL